MRIRLKALHLIVFLFVFPGFVLNLEAQDVAFSQFYSNPLYLNPAFAGSVEVPRVGLQYRNQWPGFGDAYTTYSFGFDMPVEKLRGGIGIFIMNDALANSALNQKQVDLMYSTFVRLNEDFKMYTGVQGGFHQNSLVWDKLVFSDNLDPNYGTQTVSAETPVSDPNYIYFDVSSGILVFSEKLFLGLACHHINEPRQSFYQGQEDVGVLYRKYTFHAGGKFRIFIQGHLRKKFDLSPQIIIQQQGNFQQFNYGLLANRKGFSAGVWFRQNLKIKYDALIFLFGFIKNRWQLTYSYDWTLSGLAGSTAGSNEISLSFLLKDPGKVSSYPFYRLPGEY